MEPKRLILMVTLWYLALCAAYAMAEEPTEILAESISLISCEHARQECLRSLFTEQHGVSAYIFYCEQNNLGSRVGRVRFAATRRSGRHLIAPGGCSVQPSAYGYGPQYSYAVSCHARLNCL